MQRKSPRPLSAPALQSASGMSHWLIPTGSVGAPSHSPCRAASQGTERHAGRIWRGERRTASAASGYHGQSGARGLAASKGLVRTSLPSLGPQDTQPECGGGLCRPLSAGSPLPFPAQPVPSPPSDPPCTPRPCPVGLSCTITHHYQSLMDRALCQLSLPSAHREPGVRVAQQQT